MRCATDNAPYGMRVRELLSQHLPRRLNIQKVVRKLGLSERSLRRYLTAEGTSSRDIVHNSRRDALAVHDLKRELGHRHPLNRAGYAQGPLL